MTSLQARHTSWLRLRLLSSIQWFLEHIGTDVMGDFIIDNDIKIDRYVIVDDEDFDMLDFQKENHIVKIDRLHGITNDDYDKIEKTLYG